MSPAPPSIPQPALQLSERITRLTSSLVREILAAAQAPGMISFAGGLPSADAMPILPDSGSSHDWQSPVFQQYGQSEGEPLLRALGGLVGRIWLAGIRRPDLSAFRLAARYRFSGKIVCGPGNAHAL